VTICGFWIGWSDLLTTYTISSGLQAIQRYRWSAHFTVHRCTHILGFSVFTCRILACHYSAHEVFLSEANSFLAIYSQSPLTAISRDSSQSQSQSYFTTGGLPPVSRDSRNSSHYITLHRFLYCCALIHCCKDVFTAELRNNARGANHRKHRSSIVACFPFCGSVFTGPLPSNKYHPNLYL
jgi:hypothetical protein